MNPEGNNFGENGSGTNPLVRIINFIAVFRPLSPDTFLALVIKEINKQPFIFKKEGGLDKLIKHIQGIKNRYMIAYFIRMFLGGLTTIGSIPLSAHIYNEISRPLTPIMNNIIPSPFSYYAVGAIALLPTILPAIYSSIQAISINVLTTKIDPREIASLFITQGTKKAPPPKNLN